MTTKNYFIGSKNVVRPTREFGQSLSNQPKIFKFFSPFRLAILSIAFVLRQSLTQFDNVSKLNFQVIQGFKWKLN